MTIVLSEVPITSPRFVNPVLDPIKSALTVRALIKPVAELIFIELRLLTKSCPALRVIVEPVNCVTLEIYPAEPRPWTVDCKLSVDKYPAVMN